jgi:hypothetical protein
MTMAKAEIPPADVPLDGEELKHAQDVDAAWAPSKLTALGFLTFGIAITIIIFMATRLTTCMYLDGSRP